MILPLLLLLVALVASVPAYDAPDNNSHHWSLRKDGGNLQHHNDHREMHTVMTALLDRMDAQEARIDAQEAHIKTLQARVTELETKLEKADNLGRFLSDAADCIPLFNATTQQCVMLNDYTFTATVEFRNKTLFTNESYVKFEKPAYFEDDVRINNTHKEIEFKVDDKVRVKLQPDYDVNIYQNLRVRPSIGRVIGDQYCLGFSPLPAVRRYPKISMLMETPTWTTQRSMEIFMSMVIPIWITQRWTVIWK